MWMDEAKDVHPEIAHVAKKGVSFDISLVIFPCKII